MISAQFAGILVLICQKFAYSKPCHIQNLGMSRTQVYIERNAYSDPEKRLC